MYETLQLINQEIFLSNFSDGAVLDEVHRTQSSFRKSDNYRFIENPVESSPGFLVVARIPYR
jgi:hypothetical protein